MNIRFGPAGVPIQCKGSSSLDGVECCATLGLYAMEVQFGMGVRMNKETASQLKEQSKKLDVSLSCHAPYFINFCSKEKVKISTSKRNLFEAAQAMHYAGAGIAVFHPGYYQKLIPEEAYKIAVFHLKELKEKLDQNSIKVKLGAETVGKKSQFGGLKEVLRLANDLPFIKPVLDLAHIHARGDVNLEKEEDFRKLFSLVENELPDYMEDFHFHFSEINYSDKGERNHLSLGSNNKPPFRPMLKVLKEQGYKGTIICETPKLDIDALVMKNYYSTIK